MDREPVCRQIFIQADLPKIAFLIAAKRRNSIPNEATALARCVLFPRDSCMIQFKQIFSWTTATTTGRRQPGRVIFYCQKQMHDCLRVNYTV